MPFLAHDPILRTCIDVQSPPPASLRAQQPVGDHMDAQLFVAPDDPTIDTSAAPSATACSSPSCALWTPDFAAPLAVACQSVANGVGVTRRRPLSRAHERCLCAGAHARGGMRARLSSCEACGS